MRILFLTQWFAPEPHFKGLPFAQALRARGHEVTVVTGFPNYPGGKVYPGYRIRLLQCEVMSGIRVIRVPLHPSHDRSAMGRMLNYVSFAASATVGALLLTAKTDVAYVYHPPATIGLPALALQWLRRIPCVYDVQDLWPDTLSATGMVRSRSILHLVGVWSNFVYRNVTRLVVLSPGFKRALETRGVPSRRISVILNWSPDAGVPEQAPALPIEERQRLEGRFNIVFAGNMGAAQGLASVLRAAQILSTRVSAAQLVFVGGGVALEELKTRVSSERMRNVVFFPRRPSTQMPAIYDVADVLLVHLRDDPLFEITIPSKTQTYLAAGRPIVMGVKGDAAKLVEAANAGVCCIPDDAESIAEAIVRLHEMGSAARQALGVNGRSFYGEHLEMNKGVERFEKCFLEVANEGHAI